MSLLDLLSKLLGPHRAVSVYAFLKTWGIGLAFAALTLGLGATLLLRGDDAPRHVAYLQAQVLKTTPLNNDERVGIIVDLRLPDGDTLRLTETEGLIASKLDDTACLEQRRAADGTDLYRLRQPHRCAP